MHNCCTGSISGCRSARNYFRHQITSQEHRTITTHSYKGLTITPTTFPLTYSLSLYLMLLLTAHRSDTMR